MKKQLVRFLIVGGCAVLIDGLIYLFIVHMGWLEHSGAKRVSFAVGALWAFVMNKFYTFEQKEMVASEPIIFTLVYLVGWGLNSCSHDWILSLTNLPLLAFLIATGFSTCSNFVGQKWIVFRSRKPSSA
jgi:putative flippase GtrA